MGRKGGVGRGGTKAFSNWRGWFQWKPGPLELGCRAGAGVRGRAPIKAFV